MPTAREICREVQTDGYPKQDDLSVFLHGGRERLVRTFSQEDPQRQCREPPANENARRKTKRRLWHRVWNEKFAPVLSLWTALGSYLVLLWDQHHYRDFGAD